MHAYNQLLSAVVHYASSRFADKPTEPTKIRSRHSIIRSHCRNNGDIASCRGRGHHIKGTNLFEFDKTAVSRSCHAVNNMPFL